MLYNTCYYDFNFVNKKFNIFLQFFKYYRLFINKDSIDVHFSVMKSSSSDNLSLYIYIFRVTSFFTILLFKLFFFGQIILSYIYIYFSTTFLTFLNIFYKNARCLVSRLVFLGP